MALESAAFTVINPLLNLSFSFRLALAVGQLSNVTTRQWRRHTPFRHSLYSVHRSTVAYLSRIYSLAQPRPGIEIQPLFPLPCLCVSAASRLKFHALYESTTVPLEPRGPNTGCIATSRLMFPPLSLTHAHTRSSSLGGSGITTMHPAPRPAPCVFSFRGRRSVYFILSLSNSRTDSNSAIYKLPSCYGQWLS